MQKPQLTIFHFLILILIVFTRIGVHANTIAYPQPKPPHLSSTAHILIDADSSKILAQKNATKRIPPASLTKMMTMYIISHSLKNGEIRLDDKVRISKKAWKVGGSKMFVRAGQLVSIRNLIMGIIVDSGNDACIAMAEHIGGSEENFAILMNHHAKLLGMKNSHFTDSTGLPSKEHYSTATDLAKLAQALIKDFPEYYKWYKHKWFKFNNIKQPNRNRLLWRDKGVDGIKTGHTNNAGYCLVASAIKKNMRLIAVVLGSPNESSREDSSERLLSYGFRFYKTHKLFDKQTPITKVRSWLGKTPEVSLGLQHSAFVTAPQGQYDNLKIHTLLPKTITAPIKQNQTLGTLKITIDNETLLEEPLIALTGIEKGGFLLRLTDSVRMKLNHWFG